MDPAWLAQAGIPFTLSFNNDTTPREPLPVSQSCRDEQSLFVQEHSDESDLSFEEHSSSSDDDDEDENNFPDTVSDELNQLTADDAEIDATLHGFMTEEQAQLWETLTNTLMQIIQQDQISPEQLMTRYLNIGRAFATAMGVSIESYPELLLEESQEARRVMHEQLPRHLFRWQDDAPQPPVSEDEIRYHTHSMNLSFVITKDKLQQLQTLVAKEYKSVNRSFVAPFPNPLSERTLDKAIKWLFEVFCHPGLDNIRLLVNNWDDSLHNSIEYTINLRRAAAMPENAILKDLLSTIASLTALDAKNSNKQCVYAKKMVLSVRFHNEKANLTKLIESSPEQLTHVPNELKVSIRGATARKAIQKKIRDYIFLSAGIDHRHAKDHPSFNSVWLGAHAAYCTVSELGWTASLMLNSASYYLIWHEIGIRRWSIFARIFSLYMESPIQALGDAGNALARFVDGNQAISPKPNLHKITEMDQITDRFMEAQIDLTCTPDLVADRSNVDYKFI